MIGTATQGRIAAREVVWLESSGSFGYDCGVKSDNWDIPVKRHRHSPQLKSTLGQDKRSA